METLTADKAVIEQIFDGAAPTYGQTGPNLFATFGRRLVELTGIRAGTGPLDVAVGTGAVLLPAAERIGETGRVLGIDLSTEMLRYAAEAVRLIGLKNVELGKMDAERLAFGDESFDAITCGFGLFLLPSMQKGLGEMLRTCRSGGSLGLTVWSKNPPPFEPAWKLFAEMVRAYGVEVRMPQRVAHMPLDLGTLLADCGWRQICITAETSEMVYRTEEEWWCFQLTTGARAAVYRMSEETRSQFKEDYLVRLRPHFRSDGLHLPAPVLYANAHKGLWRKSQAQRSLTES